MEEKERELTTSEKVKLLNDENLKVILPMPQRKALAMIASLNQVLLDYADFAPELFDNADEKQKALADIIAEAVRYIFDDLYAIQIEWLDNATEKTLNAIHDNQK